jgi:hypothetical protein
MLMSVLAMVYVINAVLLFLHEMESAYVKEWEILHLPGKITGFLLLHVPVIFVLFWGAIEVQNQSTTGFVIALVAGVGGLLPFVIHKLLVKKKGYFDSGISNTIIFLNLSAGIFTAVYAILLLTGKIGKYGFIS